MEDRIRTACLLLLSAIAVGGALYWLKPVMIPFVLALFISLGIAPLLDFQARRLRFPRALCLVTTLGLAAVVLLAVGAIVWASIGQLAANAASYEAHVRQLVRSLSESLPVQLPEVQRNGGLRDLTQIPVQTVGGMLMSTTNAVTQTLSQSFLVLIFVLYLVLGETRSLDQRTGLWGEIETRMTQYLVIKIAVSAATGVGVGLVLSLLGVPLALAFGLFAFLLNFVPSVGSVVATLLPLPILLMSPEISPLTAVLALALPGAIQLVIGNVVEPRLMGESLDLHPITILLALIFWGMLWGIVGMLLATPMTAILKIVFERLEPTRSVAELLGGRADSLRRSSA